MKDSKHEIFNAGEAVRDSYYRQIFLFLNHVYTAQERMNEENEYETKTDETRKILGTVCVGNSAFTLLVSTIIPIYFKNMAQNMGVSASDSTAYLSYAISISTIIVAILGPILGAVADNKNHKKPLFTFFMMIGVLGLQRCPFRRRG